MCSFCYPLPHGDTPPFNENVRFIFALDSMKWWFLMSTRPSLCFCLPAHPPSLGGWKRVQLPAVSRNTLTECQCTTKVTHTHAFKLNNISIWVIWDLPVRWMSLEVRGNTAPHGGSLSVEQIVILANQVIFGHNLQPGYLTLVPLIWWQNTKRALNASYPLGSGFTPNRSAALLSLPQFISF